MTDLGNEIFGSGNDDASNGFNGFPAGMTVIALSPDMAGFPGIGRQVRADGQIDFHDGNKILLPRGTSYTRAYEILKHHEEQAETPTTWDRQFNYRPDDGAHATTVVLQRLFGVAGGDAREVETFFGKHIIPSETRHITIAPGQRMQVPWGLMSIPNLPGLQLNLCDRHPHPLYGKVFELHVMGPRKYKDEVEKIFDAIELELRENSIYRGKALSGSSTLEFFDLSTVDPKLIVFSDLATKTLEAKLWSAIRYPDVVAAEGVSLKRTILLYGPYGTGKTSAGSITGQIAVDNGWTFLSAKTGDNIEEVLSTARLYGKTVVFYEDIDRDNPDDGDSLSDLLDAFDGITTKGGQLVVVLTTNRYKDIPKGMLRPGRLDATIKIAELDRGGCERLIRALVPNGKLAKDIDFDVVFTAMEGYLPAFIRESVNSAKLFAISRLNGAANFVISTQDLVDAADSLREQFDAHNDAPEDISVPSLDRAFQRAIQEQLANGSLVMEYGDKGVISFSSEKTQS